MPNHIIVPYEVFDSDTENSRDLNPETLYLYCWLYRRRFPYEWIVETTVDTIHTFCFHFAKGNTSRNKKTILNMLLELSDKGYISLFSDSTDKKIKYNDPLYIEFSMSFKRYNANITYRDFDLFKSPLEFYIFSYIDQYGDEGRSVSYYKWGRLARRSERTMQDTIDKMNSYQYKPRLWKFSGEYYKDVNGKTKQLENKYYTRPSDEIKKMWNSYYHKEQKTKNEIKNLNPF